MSRPDSDNVKAAVHSVGDTIGDGASAAKDHLSGAAGAVRKRAGGLLRHGDAPADLEAMPEEAKLLYCRTLAAHARGDGALDPREIANVYLFASTIGLDADRRSDVRRALASSRDGDVPTEGAAAVVELARAIPPLLDDEDRKPVMTALVRDMLRVSRADQSTSADEHECVVRVAELVFALDAAKAVDAMNRQLEVDDEYLAGRITEKEWKKRSKDAIANGAAIGVPIMAISAAGSVSGLSAAGITSGLAALGFGGVLGLSAMVTGIGTVVVLGVVVHQGVRFVLGTGQREKERRREALVQEVIRHHQQAITDLTEDVAGISSQIAEYTASTDRNAERIALLQTELSAFERALGTLQSSCDQFTAAPSS